MLNKVNVGLVGSGFSAVLHGDSYQKVCGLDVKIKAVASVEDTVHDFAKKYDIPTVYSDFADLLKDETIDVIDICTPPHIHVWMIKEALLAGKHVICEKPLTGYFGEKGADNDNVGNTCPKRVMYEKVIAELDELKEVIDSTDKLFMYAENFIYAPSIQKVLSFVKAKESKVLYMKGEESHCGSHAHHAAYWKFNGGGSLIRQGCHPLSAILYLKYKQAEFTGDTITVKSVTGDMGVTQSMLTEDEKKNILSRPVDVEDQANVVITFSDETKANVVAGDMILGGVRNLIEVYTNHGVYQPNIAPNNAMMAYHVDQEGLEDVYVTEKVETKAGWQNVFVDEEIARGYVGELQDFMECAVSGRQPQSDFRLAYDTAKVIYAAYLSDAEGKRIDL